MNYSVAEFFEKYKVKEALVSFVWQDGKKGKLSLKDFLNLYDTWVNRWFYNKSEDDDLLKYKGKWLPLGLIVRHIFPLVGMKKWYFFHNRNVKYLTLRIDTRSGNALLLNDKGKPISIEQLEWQGSGKDEMPEAIDYQQELADRVNEKFKNIPVKEI